MTVSVIIPSYKSEKTIWMCLQSLIYQQTTFSCEIIVVDSSPNTCVDKIVEKLPTVKFIKLNNKTYPGIARNIGARKALGELLIFIDSDIIIPDNWLEKVWAYYKGGHNIFIGPIDVWNKNNMLCLLEWFFEFSEFKPSMKEGIRWCLPTYALAIKKQILGNENFLNMEVSQDTELTVRLRNKGNILYFNPSLMVFHIFRTNFTKLLRKAFMFGSGNARVRQIHNVSGSKIVKNKIIGFFAIPLFAIIKFIKISWRNMKYNNLPDKAAYIVTAPLTIVMVLFWMFGFYKVLLNYRTSTHYKAKNV